MQYISPCATSITMNVSTKSYELTVDLPHTNIVQVLLAVSGQHTDIGGTLAYTCITTSYIVVTRTESRVCCKEQTITVAFTLQVRYA